MDLLDVQDLAEDLFEEHLEGMGWAFAFDNARVRAGHCRQDIRRITVSRRLMAIWPEEQVRNTLLHEIAHALVGTEHGHNETWRAKAVAIGCDGATRHNNETVPKYTAACSCGLSHEANRLTWKRRHMMVCIKCRDPLNWVEV